MTMQAAEPEAADRCPKGQPRPNDPTVLDRRSWRNWFLVVGVAFLTTIGLGMGTLPAMQEQVAKWWPWAGTDIALFTGLALAFTAFAGYLTLQQRHIMELRRHLRESRLATSERVRAHCDRLFALLTVSRSVGTETDPQTVFDVISRTCLYTFDCEQVSLMLLDRETGELTVRSAEGHQDASKVDGVRVKVGQGIAGWVAEHREPVLLGPTVEPDRYPGFRPKNERITAAMVVPIEARGELIGVLNASSRTEHHEYSDEDLQAFQVFAEHAGIACRHAEQADWMRQTIRRLDAALQERDRRDAEHAA